MLRTLRDNQWSINEFPLSADRLGELIKSVLSGDIDKSRARDVFKEMVVSGESFTNAMQAMGIEKVVQSDAEELCQKLLSDFPKIVEDVKGGKQQAIGRLIGEAKKQNPNINPGQFRQLCLKMIDEM